MKKMVPSRSYFSGCSALRSGRRGRGAEAPSSLFYMKFCVYILFSEKIKKYYVGQTSDLNKRLVRHNNKAVQSTKNGTPWNLIKYFTFDTRSEAILLESKIKKRGIVRYLVDNHFGM
jgi:putative endonuclease